MRNLLYLFGLVLLAALLHQFLPWYAIAAAGLVFGWLSPFQHAGRVFTYGLVAGILVWGVYSGYLNHQNDGLLATRIGAMLGGLPPWGLVVITALLGGIYGGLGTLTGFWGKQLFAKRVEV